MSELEGEDVSVKSQLTREPPNKQRMTYIQWVVFLTPQTKSMRDCLLHMVIQGSRGLFSTCLQVFPGHQLPAGGTGRSMGDGGLPGFKMAHISSSHRPLPRIYYSDYPYGQERLGSIAYLRPGNRGNEFAKQIAILVTKVDERKAPMVGLQQIILTE